MQKNFLRNFDYNPTDVINAKGHNTLGQGQFVGITPTGLKEHARRQKTRNGLFGMALGAFSVMTLGGGIGVVGAFGAVGFSALELAAGGAVLVGLSSAGMTQGHKTTKELMGGVYLANMYGTVLDELNPEATHVHVKWRAVNAEGETINFTGYHPVDVLRRLKLKPQEF